MSNMFGGDLFSMFQEAIPEDMKKQLEEQKKNAKVVNISKSTKTAPKSPKTKPSASKQKEVYARLPVTIACGFNLKTLTVDDFEEFDPTMIVYLVEKEETPAESASEEDTRNRTVEDEDQESIGDMTDEIEQADKSTTIIETDGNKSAKADDSSAYLYDDSIPKITLENIRKRLELEFPAFTKERTKMEYNVITNTVIPVTFSGSLGNSLKYKFVAVNNLTGAVLEFDAESFSAARAITGPEYAIMDKTVFDEVFHV